MRIEVRYESSQGPHVMELTRSEIDGANRGSGIQIVQEAPGKTLTISGSPNEMAALAGALLSGQASHNRSGETP